MKIVIEKVNDYDHDVYSACREMFDDWHDFKEVYQVLREQIFYGIAIPFLQGRRTRDFKRALGI